MLARFEGDDIVSDRDDERLTHQIDRVFDCMCDGQWRSLQEIAVWTGDGEASVSAQLRNLRKVKYGAHTLYKEYVDAGLYRYRLAPATDIMPSIYYKNYADADPSRKLPL